MIENRGEERRGEAKEMIEEMGEERKEETRKDSREFLGAIYSANPPIPYTQYPTHIISSTSHPIVLTVLHRSSTPLIL